MHYKLLEDLKENKIISQEETCTMSRSRNSKLMLEHAAPLVKVTIVPRRSLGAAWYLLKKGVSTDILDEMAPHWVEELRRKLFLIKFRQSIGS